MYNNWLIYDLWIIIRKRVQPPIIIRRIFNNTFTNVVYYWYAINDNWSHF